MYQIKGDRYLLIYLYNIRHRNIPTVSCYIYVPNVCLKKKMQSNDEIDGKEKQENEGRKYFFLVKEKCIFAIN